MTNLTLIFLFSGCTHFSPNEEYKRGKFKKGLQQTTLANIIISNKKKMFLKYM